MAQLNRLDPAAPRRLRAADALVAVAIAAASVVALLVADEPGARPADGPAFLLLLLMAAPLAVRRHWPTSVVAIVSLVALVSFAVGYPGGPPTLALLVALYIADALRAGASGFLLKDIEPDDLRAAVHTIIEGGALLSPSVTRTVIAQFAQQADRRPDRPERLEHLTDREREVVALVARGMSNDEIGAELFISPATAKTHVSRAMNKLHARDRAQLVVIAYETGLAGYDR